MRMRNQGRLLSAASLLALSILSGGTAALAADAAPGATAAADTDDTGVAEITVTASRRVERLQSVPLAVTAVSGEDFERTGLRGPGDLQFLSPSVQLSTVGGNGIYLRGAGINSQNAGTEQSVGMVIDGVVIGFVDDIGGDLTDAERIEVLRGPQGTQFGKNASAGVVSITTRAPKFDAFSLAAHASFGEHNDSNNSVKVNVPLADNLATRVSMFYQNRSGVFPNVVRQDKQGDVTQWGGRIKLLWEPLSDMTVTVVGDYRDENRQPNFIQSYRNAGLGYTQGGVRYAVPGLGNIQAGITPSADNVTIGESQPGDRITKTGGVSGQVDYQLGAFTLTSLTAFRRMDRIFHSPFGSGVEAALYSTQTYIGNQFSQEFRLTSPGDKPLTYIAGLYYYNRATHGGSLGVGKLFGYAEAFYGPGALVATNGGRVDTTNNNTSYAAFLDGAYAFGDHFKLLGGVRYTYDKVQATSATAVLPGIFPTPNTVVKKSDAARFTNDAVSWRFGAQYTFNPDVMIYATMARGYKGPVADTSQATIGQVKPEYVRSYEVGFKSSWFDRKLQFNLTLFHQKFKDFQTTVLNTTIFPVGFVLGNAGGERTRGVELELQAAPVAGLHFSGGVTYLDAKFTDFRAACYSTAAPIPMQSTTNPDGIGGCYRIPGSTASFTQAAGSPLNNASKWSYKLAADYKKDITENYTVDLSTTWVWRSSFRTSGYDPNTENPGYGTLALNAGVGAPDGKWRLGVFARNLFDKSFTSAIQANSYDTGGYTNVLNIEAVRTVGMTLDFKI
ncbi:MAG TPA: TonB-dependent receptor [Sphingobium sp.]